MGRKVKGSKSGIRGIEEECEWEWRNRRGQEGKKEVRVGVKELKGKAMTNT